MKKTFLQVIIIMALTLTTTLRAQVTIGSGEKPNAGALLDLKMANGNTKKGLLLPRVELEQDNKLYPMLTAGYDPLEEAKHAGLIVYNIGIAGDICPGLYVWDSTQWIRLSTTPCIPLEGLALDPLSLNRNLIIQDSFVPQLIFTPADAINKNVKWFTTPAANPYVFVNSTSGLVRGLREGLATIKAISESGGHVVSTTVNVKDMAIAVDKTNLQLLTGEQETITTTVGPTWAPNKAYTWTSADNTKVTVSNTGLVAAKANTGGATVLLTAQTDKRNKTATVNVEVADLIVDITDASPIRMIAADTKPLTTTVTPTWAPNKSLVWASSNEYLAVVSTTGEVTAKNAGTVYITAKSLAKPTVFDRIAVEVANMAVAIDQTGPINLLTGEHQDLTCTVTPVWAANKDVTWTTNNAAAATVNATGRVTAVGPGTANITATTAIGGATSSIQVKVETLLIKLNKDSVHLLKSRSITVTSTISPTWAAAKYKDKVKWTIADATAATITPSADKSTCTVLATATASLNVNTTVIAEIEGLNVSDTLKLSVYNKVKLTLYHARLFEGSTYTLKATAVPDPALNGFHLQFIVDNINTLPGVISVGQTTGTVVSAGTIPGVDPYEAGIINVSAVDNVSGNRIPLEGKFNSVSVHVLRTIAATVKDGDGNVYNTKKIGNTYWLTQNLYTTAESDGYPLPTNSPARLNPGMANGQEAYSVASKAALASGTVTYGEHATQSDVRNKTVNKKIFAQTFGLLYNHGIGASPSFFKCPKMVASTGGEVYWDAPTEIEIKELAAVYGYSTEPDIVGTTKVYRGVGEVMRTNNNYYVGLDNYGFAEGHKWGQNDAPGKAGLSGLNFSPGGYAYTFSYPSLGLLPSVRFSQNAYFSGVFGQSVWSLGTVNGDLTLTPLTSRQKDYYLYPIRCVLGEIRP